MNQDLNRGFSPSTCTDDHMYWASKPDLWIGAVSAFSTLEVLPLFLLVMEVIGQRRHIVERENFPYKLAYPYILARRSGTSSAPACSVVAPSPHH